MKTESNSVLQPTPEIDFGRRAYQFRVRGQWLSWRIDRRIARTNAILALLCLVFMLLSLALGRYPVGLGDLVDIARGGGDATLRTVVLEWRLPRILIAMALGGALAMSGAIFQTLTRNPLGSPDIIGFSTGSYTGALLFLVLGAGGSYSLAFGAMTGGVLTATAVYLLAFRQGVQGFRLIVVGIGVSAMLSAFNAWLIRKTDIETAMNAAIWGAGSLNGLSFDDLRSILALLTLILVALVVLSPSMRQLELSEDTVAALGIDVTRIRLSLMMLGVGLTAIVTASAGPIAFISLAAPQLARRLVASSSIPLTTSALIGGLLLVAADWIAQNSFASQLPVGIVTTSIGGAYFIWLLFREQDR